MYMYLLSKAMLLAELRQYDRDSLCCIRYATCRSRSLKTLASDFWTFVSRRLISGNLARGTGYGVRPSIVANSTAGGPTWGTECTWAKFVMEIPKSTIGECRSCWFASRSSCRVAVGSRSLKMRLAFFWVELSYALLPLVAE